MPQRPVTPPTSPEQAVAVVRSRYAQPTAADGSPLPLHVHEFDIGYLVYPAPEPTAAGEAAVPQPAAPGGSKVVVAKDTGETSTVPNLPTDSAVELYRRRRQR